MFDLYSFLENELNASRKQKPTIIFSEVFDPRIPMAALSLIRFANIIIPAAEKEFREYVRAQVPEMPENRLNYLLTYAKLVDISKENPLCEELAMEYQKTSAKEGKACSSDEARSFVRSPVGFSILCTRLGYADTVVGGLTRAPRDFIRPALKFLAGIREPFEAGVFILPDSHREPLFPHNIAIFSDVGVTIRMTPEKLANIAVGTCRMVRDLFPESVLPVVHGVIVSYSTKGTDEGPSVALQREAALLIQDKLAKLVEKYPRYRNIKLDTEVQVCYALGANSPTLSGPEGDEPRHAFSDTNIIIAPNLDLGNFLYHSYAKSYPESIKLTQMGGVRHKIVEFARESRWEEVALGVKANILRLWKHGKWENTPRDYFFKRYKVLAINPGSTSTKISLYEGERNLFTEELSHRPGDLAAFTRFSEQYRFRKQAILDELKRKGFVIGKDPLDAVVARGGLLRPIPSGVYGINRAMTDDLAAGVQGDHASNLGGLIARELGDDLGLPAFIVDPPVVDEVDEVSRITGMKDIRRRVISHALSQIASAKRYAEENGVFYSELNLIVAHLGGGISIGAHYKGRYIDVNNALNGEGPFSPERSGSLPPGQLIDLCYSGKFTHQEMKLKNKGNGGLLSLLGTSDFIEVEKRYQSKDAEAVATVNAMAYQVAKEISSLIPAFRGEKADQILMTGGLARSGILTDLIRDRLRGLGIGITLYPGQNEMQALALGALRALQGKESVNEYDGKN